MLDYHTDTDQMSVFVASEQYVEAVLIFDTWLLVATIAIINTRTHCLSMQLQTHALATIKWLYSLLNELCS